MARIFPKQWQRAVHAAVTDDDQLLAGMDGGLALRSAEQVAASADSASLAPCTGTLSAVLRRFALLSALSGQPFHGGQLELRVAAGPDGAAQLVDCSAGLYLLRGAATAIGGAIVAYGGVWLRAR